MTSLFALAATGSVAMFTNPSYTSAEPASSPPTSRAVPSPRSAPFPMATSSKFASAPFEMAFADSTTSDASTPNSRPKVQIRRTVRRRYGAAEGPFAVHDNNNLPERFRFTKYDDAAECEGDAAPFIEEEEGQKVEVVADETNRYEVS